MTNRINQQKIRKDVVMLSVSLFAILGGTYVFRSFASQKYDTTRPGEVPYNQLLTEETGAGIKYQITTRDGLSYCFNDPGYIILSNGLKKELTFNAVKNRYCYVSEITGQDRIYIAKPAIRGSLLIY